MVRKAKRPRASSQPTQTSSPGDSHEAFMQWSQQQGVEIINVMPQRLPGRGLGLVTTQSISEGARILFVPEEAMFKPRFTFFRQNGLEKCSPQAKLALSSLSYFAPDQSAGKVWSDTWPTEGDMHDCMPLYWDAETLSDLPTSLEAPLKRQRLDYRRDWLTCEKLVQKLGFDESSFRYHWMIVNSRSFHWAPPRGGPGCMVMCPFIDYINHGPTGTGCIVVQRSDGYEVIAQRAYKAGEEVLASYGAHSNEKLFIHYGFLIDYEASNPSTDDEIRIDVQVLSLLSDDNKQQLSDLGYLGPFALIPTTDASGKTSGWEPCFKTQVAVRATFQTCNEWEYFAGTGEDLSSDSSAAVAARLSTPLTALKNDIESKLEGGSMASEPDRLATKMIRQRWKQIQHSVQWYLDHSTG